MNLKRIALLLAIAALVGPSVAGAQDQVVIPDDPLARVDSVLVRDAPDGTGKWFDLPVDALLPTLLVFQDRDLRNRIAYSTIGDSVGVIGPEISQNRLFIRYRRSPLFDSRTVSATPIVPPPDPDSVSSFVPVDPVLPPSRQPPETASRISRSGSITRGVITGNRRDATIESGLRMQLEGEIVDGVELRAVLSDENTPIVPEGTTQRISEFDKVFIEIESSRVRAQLGDFEMAVGASSYARLTRKLQGAQVTGRWGGTGTAVGAGSATVAGADARGVFRAQSLQILEGVQGPYRLEGNDGERFIILIPGSEVVYLDGTRLDRGITEDYVVDYATAEITFSSRRVMSPDRRVQVEFQYTTNQFTRTILASEATSGLWRRPDGSSRLTLGFTLLRESDGSQFADEFGLSAADSLLLAMSGDSRAARSGAVVVEYDPEAPFAQYVRELRPTQDGADTVFVALTTSPPDSATVYRVQFSRVESGTGKYARVGRSINGIVYEFVGSGLGDYEPIRLLPRPRRQQLFDIRGMIEPIRNLKLVGEWARSNLDLNRLSDVDSADDDGDAVNVGLTYLSPSFVLPVVSDSRLHLDVSRTFRSASFNTFDRVRTVEFGRDWNLPFEVSSTGASVAGQSESVTVGLANLRTDVGTVGVEAGRISLGSSFEADRRVARVHSADSAMTMLRYTGERITSTSSTSGLTGSWLRHAGKVGRGIGRDGIAPYLEAEFENRTESPTGRDSLHFRSVRATELRPGVAVRSANVVATVEGELRNEDRPVGGLFGEASTSRTLLSTVKYRSTGPLRVEANAGVRRTEATSNQFAAYGIEDRESVVLGTNGDFRPLMRAVSVAWLYEAQTERTPRLQEIYVRIGPEQGEYVWTDANMDGAIQIEEFIRETTPNEGTYARTFVPSDSLFNIVGVKARLRLDLRPDRILRNRDTPVARVLRLFTSATTIEVTEKNRSEDTYAIYALRQSRFRKPGVTLSGRMLFRQDLSIGRPASALGADLSLSSVQSLSDLAAGLEQRLLTIGSAVVRYRPADRLRLQGGGRIEQNRVESANFPTRTFNIHSQVVHAEANVVVSASTSVSGGFDIAWRDDTFGSRSATILKLPVELRYQRARRYQLSTRFELANVELSGDAVGLAEFELTDGRGRGRSSLWSIVGQWSFNQYLRGSLAYDGRAPANAPVIHTMRMQLSAVF